MTSAPAALDTPFKGLAPFEDSELDALLFFGRDRESGVVTANLVAVRLTLLYGQSGVGKTSLLLAAVVRDLRGLAEAPAVAFHSAWAEAEPERAVAQAVAAAADVQPEASLIETVESAIVARGELYLILDQLEEYLLYHGSERGPGPLADALPDLVNRRELPVHVLLGIREDTLARLDAFKSRIPGLFSNSLRLDHLDREQARSAIVGPIERYGELVPEDAWAIEPALVDAVLDGVETGKLVHGPGGRGAVKASGGKRHVETPYLQLVMQRLWEAERAEGSRVLHLSTLERLGGAPRIVEQHLERALASLDAEEKAMAARMFHHLVTPSGTKIAHATSDLAEYAGASEAEVGGVLSALARARIVKPAAGNGAADAHEIYHDVLSGAVLAWRARYEAESAIARERSAARRRHRRLVLVVFVALVALAAMAAITVYALSERRDARAQAILVHARELGASARSQLPTDPELALALAAEAAQISPSPQAEGVLRDALVSSKVRGVFRARGPVTSGAYSPDGATIATASDDAVVRLYDARTNSLLRSLRQGTPATKVVFSPDGKRLLVGGRDGAAREWGVANGRLRRILRNGFAPIRSVAYGPGGALVMTAGGRRVRMWKDGRLVASLPHATPVRFALLSPDGSLVLTNASERTARVWRTTDGSRAYTIRQDSRIASAAFSGFGNLLATGAADGLVRIWDRRNGALQRALVGHVGPVTSVAFSRRGLLVTASADGTARVWQPSTGKVESILVGHTNPVVDASFSPDGFSIVTASADRTARVWKPRGGSVRVLLAGHKDTVDGAVFSPDATRVLTWSDDHTARVWDPQSQPQLHLVARVGSPIRSSALAPDGRFAVAATDRGTVLVPTSGGDVRTLGPRARTSSASCSADRDLCALAGPSGVAVWRIPSGRIVGRPVRGRSIGAVAVSPDGKLVAGADGTDIAVWTVDGKLVRVLHGRGTQSSVAFSPDGSRIAAGSEDNKARIWDRVSGRRLALFGGHADDVTAVAFSPDGQQLATASRDHRARIWDAATGASEHVLVGHFATVSDVAFSPDGRWLVTAGPSTAGLWEVASGRLLLFLRGHAAGGRLRSAAFDRSGMRVVTAGQDGTIRAWRCDICPGVDGLISLARKRLAATGRSLTPDERRLYIG